MKGFLKYFLIRNHTKSASNKPELEEQIQQKIRNSIQTARYKNLDPLIVQNIHLDGEEWE